MPTDDILIRFKADTQQLRAEFEDVKKSLTGVNTEQKKVADQQKKTADQVKISTKEIAGETEKLKSSNSLLGSSFAKLGGLIAAAFSVQQMIAFGNTAVTEFAKAEKSAFQLLGALNGNEAAQRRLLGLAKDFQKRFGIDNDVIVAQESFLAIQQRTETQIRKIIQAAIQLSAVTGEDLGSAVQKLDGTFEGITGRLGKLDSRIAGLSKSQLANGAVIDIINEKYAGFAEKGLEGVSGQLQKIAVAQEEASKSIGKSLAPVKLFFTQATLEVVEFFGAIIKGADEAAQAITGKFKKEKLIDPKEFQIEGFFDQFRELPEKVLNDIKKFDEGIIASGKKVSSAKKQQADSEIEAIKRIFEARKLEAEAAKKASELSPEEAKKALELLQKDAKERQDSQKTLREFTLKAEQDNITDEETLRKTAASKEIKDEQELGQVLRQIEIEQDLKRRALLIQFGESTTEIDKKIADEIIANNKATQKEITDNVKESFDERIQAIESAAAKEIFALSGRGLSQEKFEKESLLITKKKLEDEVAEYRKAGKDIADILTKLGDVNQQLAEKTAKQIQETLDEISQSAQAFNDILNANTESQIQSLTDATQRQTDSIDKQQEHLQKLFDSHRISQEEFDKRSKALADSRAKVEKQSQDKIKALKLEEAKREKELSIFKIALTIAEALADLNFFKAAIAGAELIAVIAKPLPAFKKGTKGKQGSGLALVGEEGAELTYMPSGAKVLPAQRTHQYSDVIDSMFDGRLDEYIHKNYVLPALKLQSPNVNVNIDYKKLAKANKQRDSISIDNLHELAEMFDHNPRRVI